MTYNPFPDNIKHIAVVAPAGGEKKRADIENAKKTLESLEKKVTLMPNISAGSEFDFLSAPEEKRVSDIHAAWQDDSVDLIFALRGGYGSVQLLNSLDWTLLRKRKIPFLGYSDITGLMLAFYKMGVGIPIVTDSFSKISKILECEFSCKWLKNALSEEKNKPEKLSYPKGFRKIVIKKGAVKASLIPTNMTLLSSLIGTDFMPDLSGKLLLLEDLNELPYELDRILNQLLMTGVLQKISGLIFGQFKGCGYRKDREKIFAKYAEFVNGPVISGVPHGHTLPMWVLKYDAMISINSNSEISVLD